MDSAPERAFPTDAKPDKPTYIGQFDNAKTHSTDDLAKAPISFASNKLYDSEPRIVIPLDFPFLQPRIQAEPKVNLLPQQSIETEPNTVNEYPYREEEEVIIDRFINNVLGETSKEYKYYNKDSENTILTAQNPPINVIDAAQNIQESSESGYHTL